MHRALCVFYIRFTLSLWLYHVNRMQAAVKGHGTCHNYATCAWSGQGDCTHGQLCAAGLRATPMRHGHSPCMTPCHRHSAAERTAAGLCSLDTVTTRHRRPSKPG